LNKPVILITGASSGIGAATARLFSERGYHVVLAARREDRLRALADEIEAAGGQALPVPTDITRLDHIENLVETSLAWYGQIDVLFNNAGFGRLKWLEQLDPDEDIELQLQTNLRGAILTTRVVLLHMIERRAGHIINMASIAGLIGPPTYSIYSATKFGLRGFTEALRREVGIWGIRVSGIYPGGVATEFGQHTGIDRRTGLRTPAFLRLSAEDVARDVYRLVERPRRMLIIPWPMRIAVWLNVLWPGVVDWGIQRIFTIRERPPRGLH